MRAGNLDLRILIEFNTPVQDGTGEPDPVWATLATVWGGFDRSRGATRFVEDKRLSTRDVVFKLRYRTDITELMRMTLDGVVYKITAIEKIGRKEGLRVAGLAQVSA